MDVTHNPQEKRFEVNLEGHQAVLEYEERGDTLVYYHTGVPTELEGRGIAKALAKEALAYARQQGKKVVPSCSFVRGYIQRNPEYEDLVAR